MTDIDAHSSPTYCNGCGLSRAYICLNSDSRGYIDLCDTCIKELRAVSKQARRVRLERKAA